MRMISQDSPLSREDEQALIDRLRSTRVGFREEGKLHRFLLDSYTGGGGFANGRVPTPNAPFFSRAAYEYSYQWMAFFNAPVELTTQRGKAAQQQWSYLLPFHGESQAEYINRVNNSTYSNPVEPIVNVTHAFLMENDAQREGLPPLLSKWSERVSLMGQTIRQYMDGVLMRGQLAGWCATGADLPDGPELGSLAESIAAGKVPFLSVYWPQQIYDYDLDGAGNFTAIKVSQWHELPRRSMLDRKELAERITLWYPDHWERYEIVEDIPTSDNAPDKIFPTKPKAELRDVKTGPNPFGKVPFCIFRWKKPLSDDPIKGQPQIGTIAHIARDLFNLESELRHQLRTQVFATLVVPQSNSGSTQGTVEMGVGNFLEEPWNGVEGQTAKGLTRFIAPPVAPADTYQKEIEESKRDAYRTSLIDPGQSRQAETAEARKLRFRQTNALLGSIASNLDQHEQEIFALVAIPFGIPEQKAREIVIKRKQDYALAHIIDEVIECVTGLLTKISSDLPPEAKSVLVIKALRAVLTDVSDEDMAEIEQAVKDHIQAEADKPAQPPPPPAPAIPGADEPPAKPSYGAKT